MKNKTDFKLKKWLRRIWGALPILFFVVLVLVIVLLSARIKSKIGVQLKKQVAEAASLLSDYGVTDDDLLKLVAQKIGEEDLEALMKKADEMAMVRQKRPDMNVVTLELVPSAIRDRINLPGTTEPWVKLKVLAEVHGKVIKEVIEEGDSVKKGDIIAILDSRDYKNAYNSAKASYKTASASLNRLRKLHKERLSPRSQLDDAVALAQNYKSSMDTAALNLERCTIRSPISGVVNHLFIEKGKYLNISDEVVEILQIDRVKIKVGIPESDVDAVRKLEDFDVRIDALNKRIFQAKKLFLSRTADSTARLYNLDLVLDNPAGEILPDMFVRVEIVKKEVQESISVPLYSVISKNNENIVYVVSDGKAYSRVVELGLQEDWRIEITKGLKAGEQLIVVGHRSVNDDQTVNVVRTVRDPGDVVK